MVCLHCFLKTLHPYKMALKRTVIAYLRLLAAFVMGFCFATVAALTLVKEIWKNGWRILKSKERIVPPSCLDDPSLGTHGYVHLTDVKIHYVSNGAEDKPLMLLVHGFPEFWFSWRYQIKEFSKDYRVVAIDQRGYNDSDKPNGVSSYTIPKLVTDVKGVIEGLGYKSCVLAGHDWGGAVVWAFSRAHPDMVDKLIVMNAPHPLAFKEYLAKHRSQLKKSWYMFLFQMPCIPEIMLRKNDMEALCTMFRTGESAVKLRKITDDEMEAYKYAFSKPKAFTYPINYYRAAIRHSAALEQRLRTQMTKKFTKPTLIIWGVEDTALERGLAEESVKHVPGGVVKYIEGASHWVQIDAPDIVNKHMWEFLQN